MTAVDQGIEHPPLEEGVRRRDFIYVATGSFAAVGAAVSYTHLDVYKRQASHPICHHVLMIAAKRKHGLLLIRCGPRQSANCGRQAANAFQ